MLLIWSLIFELKVVHVYSIERYSVPRSVMPLQASDKSRCLTLGAASALYACATKRVPRNQSDGNSTWPQASGGDWF